MERSHRTPFIAQQESTVETLVMCSWCMGQRSILETSLFGLLPVVCQRCRGDGRETRLRDPGRSLQDG